MSDRQRPKVGEILVRAGVIDNQQLRAALGEQTRWGGHLGATLIKLGFVEEKDLVRALASQLDLPMATLEGKRIPQDVLDLVPREVADRERVLPLFVKREGGRVFLYVGAEDPGNLEAFDDLAFRTGMLIKPVMVAPSELFEAIDRCYHRAAASGAAVSTAAGSAAEPASDAGAQPAVGSAAARPASVVTPGTEELARHWSQSDAAMAGPGAAVQSGSVEASPSPAAQAAGANRTDLSGEPETFALDDAIAPGGQAIPSGVVAAEASADSTETPQRKPRPGVVVQALLEILIEKGVLTRDEFVARMRELETAEAGRD